MEFDKQVVLRQELIEQHEGERHRSHSRPIQDYDSLNGYGCKTVTLPFFNCFPQMEDSI